MRISVFTWHGVVKAYSCLLYLRETLTMNNDVDIWSCNHKTDFNESELNWFHSFLDTWYGNIKRVRVYFGRLHVMYAALHSDVLIINDLDFFELDLLKKIIS